MNGGADEQARFNEDHNEKIRNFKGFSAETIAAIREQRKDEEERRLLFGDDEPSVWFDRYLDDW